MERMKARTNSTNALGLSSSAKEVVSSWKSTVRVRFWRVDLAALPMCHLHLIRPRKRMRYDEDNALKDQDNRQGFTAAPLNAMECGRCNPLVKVTGPGCTGVIGVTALFTGQPVKSSRGKLTASPEGLLARFTPQSPLRAPGKDAKRYGFCLSSSA